MAIEYLNRGMSIAIENVWSPLGFDILRNELSKNGDLVIKSVWLKCERKENHKRDEQRVPEDQMKERVDIVNEELNSYEWPEYVNVLDTTDLRVEDVLSAIEKFS